MSRKASVLTLFLLGAVGLLVASAAAGNSASSNRDRPGKLAPRVFGTGTLGPVCGRKSGDGTLRFVRLHQPNGTLTKCKAGESGPFYIHVRFKLNRRGLGGPIGPRGRVGQQGVQGLRGLQGQVGASGLQGLPGLDGAVGPMGPTGEQGIQGLVGETGGTGAQGIQGLVGEAGPAGANGTNGANGADGSEGKDGADGATGPAGPIGPAGPQGLVGPAGPAGSQGDTGPAGPAGPAGPQGPAGADGADGLDGSSIITVAGGTASGDKQFTVTCPADHVALSGGFNIQGSVTASYRSNASGNPTGNTSWTIVQSSGAALSGTVYVYCVPTS
jgi:hypothetical protein